MDICLYCLAMVAFSTLLGALLMYLSNRSKSANILRERDDLQRESDLTKNRLSRLTTEFNDHKAISAQRIESKEAEVNKLNKLNLSLSRDNKSGPSQAELDHKYIKWKKRAENLSNELEYLKAKVVSKKKESVRKPNLTQAQLDHKYIKWKKRAENLSSELEYIKAKVHSGKGDSGTSGSKELDNVKSKLAKALKKIRKQDMQLMDVNSNKSSSGIKKKGSGKKKKKIKKLQEELIKLKGKLKNKK